MADNDFGSWPINEIIAVDMCRQRRDVIMSDNTSRQRSRLSSGIVGIMDKAATVAYSGPLW
jgi:hypothetical protein